MDPMLPFLPDALCIQSCAVVPPDPVQSGSYGLLMVQRLEGQPAVANGITSEVTQ